MLKKLFFVLLFIVSFNLIKVSNAMALVNYCTNNAEIAHCETFDCPSGDTNGNSICDLDDKNASLSDIRNDGFCQKPVSGCGVIHYYEASGGQSCRVNTFLGNASCEIKAFSIESKTVGNVVPQVLSYFDQENLNESKQSKNNNFVAFLAVPPFAMIGLLTRLKRKHKINS